jgi:exonuclease SbcC
MKWIFKLLNKPGAKRSAPSSPRIDQAAKPVEDVEGLRNALAIAVDNEEQMQLTARLGRALVGRSQSPRAEDPPEVWVAAICNAPDKVLALDWCASLTGDAWLGEVAKEARMAEVRYACAQRIESTAALEQVAQASRDKDRRVYRHCTDLLRQRRQAQANAQRAQEIASELRGLLAAAPLPHTRLAQLKKQLSALGEAGEPSLECDALMQQALDRLHQEAEARRDMQTRQGAVVTLASECARATWPWSEQLDSWRARHDSLRQDWASLPSWLAGEAGARVLGETLREIESRLATFADDDERVLSCEQFLAALDAGLPPSADSAAAWDALAKPQHPDARQPLESRWQALSAIAPPIAASEPAAPEVPPPPRPQPRIDHAAVRGLLDTLEQVIVQGHLADANATEKQIKTMLGSNSLHGAQESRRHDLHVQLETLRGWARWGTGQVREKLIAAAGELLIGERDVEELAQAIAVLREEWKRLNVHSPSTKAQWESFDATLEKAYQPVAAHRAAEAVRQAEVRVAKEALCDGWEAEAAGIVWEYADFKVIEARRAEMVKQWRAAPQAGFRDERGLRKRFDTLIGGLDARLVETRAAEYERREQLIAQAEALNAQPDLGRAMTEAKALQGRWNQQSTPVRLKRKDEEKLWQRFRVACNAVFERRDAQRAEQEVQRQEQAQSRQLLLDAFAANLNDADGNAIKQALAQFRSDWVTTRPAARDHADKLEARANELQQQAQRRLDERRKEKHRERFELLAQKAVLAERVEAAALAGGLVQAILAETKQAWSALPRLPGNGESLLAQRFAAASGITHAVLATGRETREALLLDLEIALGLPSPEAYAAVRRERQLERLQNRFGAASVQGAEPEELLARCYATAAPPDAECDWRIKAIVCKLAEQQAAATSRSGTQRLPA